MRWRWRRLVVPSLACVAGLWEQHRKGKKMLQQNHGQQGLDANVTLALRARILTPKLVHSCRRRDAAGAVEELQLARWLGPIRRGIVVGSLAPVSLLERYVTTALLKQVLIGPAHLQSFRF